MRTLPIALVATLLLLPTVPSAAASSSRIDVDLQDLPGDVIIDPRQGEAYVGERDTIDVVRYVQRAEGDEVVVELHFATGPGEPNAALTLIGQMGRSMGQGFLLNARWDAQGKLPASVPVSITVGAPRDATANVTVDGRVVALRMPLPPEAVCMSVTGSVDVRAGDAEYTDSLSLEVSPCDEATRLDGAQGDCPAAPAPSGRDPMAVELEDDAGDVRRISGLGEDDGAATDAEQYDITRVTSAREGDRIVQSVTLAAPRNASRELHLQVYTRVSGERDGDDRPEDALFAQYWRFANGSQQDRSHGSFAEGLGGGDFPVELEIEGATYTFSWCASLLPADARCFAIEAVASTTAFLYGGIRDTARPAIDPCAGASAPPTRAPTMPAGGDEDVGEEPSGEEDEEEPAQTPGLGVLALLGAAAVLALARRR